MKHLTIVKLNDSLVKFNSPIGCGLAVWHGNEIDENFCYDVEFDIDDCFEWGKNIYSADDDVSKISYSDEYVMFCSKVISYEDDGVLSISLNGDVIFIEVSSFSHEAKYVSFFTTPYNISIYPVEF